MTYIKKIKTITDADLLILILNKELVIENLNTPDPLLIDRGNPRKANLCGTRGKRYRWEISRNGTKRTIMRAKLVYMYATQSLIPNGKEIHHKNHNPLDDSINNLELQDHSDHLTHHHPKRRI